MTTPQPTPQQPTSPQPAVPQSAQHATPPAWYPDPDPNNPGGTRWWDGTGWTQHFSAPAPSYQAGYQQQAVTPRPLALAPVAPGTSSLTWQIWLVVGLPLVSAIAIMFVDYTGYFESIVNLGSGTSTNSPDYSAFSSSMSTFVVSVLLIDLLSFVVYGLGVMFAFFDHRELGRRGFARPFHWAWAFLSGLVYVIGRTVVARRRGGRDALWPIWGLVAVTVVGIVLAIVKVSMIFNDLSGIVGQYGSQL